MMQRISRAGCVCYRHIVPGNRFVGIAELLCYFLRWNVHAKTCFGSKWFARLIQFKVQFRAEPQNGWDDENLFSLYGADSWAAELLWKNIGFRLANASRFICIRESRRADKSQKQNYQDLFHDCPSANSFSAASLEMYS